MTWCANCDMLSGTTTTRHFATWEQTTTHHFRGGDGQNPLQSATGGISPITGGNAAVIRPIPNRLSSPPLTTVVPPMLGYDQSTPKTLLSPNQSSVKIGKPICNIFNWQRRKSSRLPTWKETFASKTFSSECSRVCVPRGRKEAKLGWCLN